jgi:hypothetical protein
MFRADRLTQSHCVIARQAHPTKMKAMKGIPLLCSAQRAKRTSPTDFLEQTCRSVSSSSSSTTDDFGNRTEMACVHISGVKHPTGIHGLGRLATLALLI